MANDLTQSIIQQQIALNSGAINISNLNGSYQFVDSATGQPITKNTVSAGNFLLSNVPGIYQTSLRASVYNYAVSLFSGKNVPDEVVDTLAAMATYYSVQTGQSVTSLFDQGILLDQFLATINNFRGNTSQIGYAGLNISPNWINNPVLRACISKAIEPWDAYGTYIQRDQYNVEPVGFTYYATDTDVVYVRDNSAVNGWVLYATEEPIWPI
jgi:hypothetical protein